MLSGLQLNHKKWPDLISIVQSALNNPLSRHRGYYGPLTAFTFLQPTPPIRTFIRPDTGKPVTVPDVISSRFLNIAKLQ